MSKRSPIFKGASFYARIYWHLTFFPALPKIEIDKSDGAFLEPSPKINKTLIFRENNGIK